MNRNRKKEDIKTQDELSEGQSTKRIPRSETTFHEKKNETIIRRTPEKNTMKRILEEGESESKQKSDRQTDRQDTKMINTMYNVNTM